MLASERSRLVTELSECLKIYDMLGKWETAEEVIRRDIVQPFVKKVQSLHTSSWARVDIILYFASIHSDHL